MRKISAFPVKSFFIETLVKDISLHDAILDLVDNSIDSYIKRGLTDKRNIDIDFDETKFVINDNCGGINRSELLERVFRFGKTVKEKGRTISVFGIGLKRAIFKMGRRIVIETDDGQNFCSVLIDDDWLKDESNWELLFNEDTKSTGTKHTKITITEIYPHISDELGNTTFQNALLEKIGETYSVFLEERVIISVNDNIVPSFDFRFLHDNKCYRPYHKVDNYDGVEVEIYAGYTPDVKDQGQTYGWFVFCNDRLVIKNDTSERTGWGGAGERKYHYPEDNRFLGLIFFRSDDPLSLPWQTTKSNIQFDSKVYKRAQVEMKSLTRRFVDTIRLAGRTKDPKTQETIGKALFEGVPSKPREYFAAEHDELMPKVKGIKTFPDTTTIQYQANKSLAMKAKERLGNQYMSNKTLGEKTFEYFVKMEDLQNE